MVKQYNYKGIKENGKIDTGAPTKYLPDYCQDIVLFFEKAPVFERVYESDTSGSNANEKFINIPAQMPSLFRWCQKIGITHKTMLNWSEEYPEFLQSLEIAKQIQKEWIIRVGQSGLGSSSFIQFVAKNVTDMKDKVENDITVTTYEKIAKQKKDYGFQK